MTISRTRLENGPALFSYGFRPFFLFGAIWAALAMLLWLPMLAGGIATRSLLAPVDWHTHELMFGYVSAIVAGFLLTAIPNWTGRLPVRGVPLALLFLLWLAGRAAIWFSADLGWFATALIDCAFLFSLTAAAAVEIVAGRNWRNLLVLGPVTILLAANVLFHVEVQFHGISDISKRLAIAAAIVLIAIIGGRIIPSFTRNWLVRENPGRLPAPFGRFDAATLAVSAGALGLWIFLPGRMETGVVLIAAGLANLLRLASWAGERTLSDALLLVLHVAYLFVPAGLIVSGFGTIAPDAVPAVAGIHVFGVGAIGAMTLAVMARATLGHTGRVLHAGTGTILVFCAIVLATPLRFAAALMPERTWLLHASATLWIAAFAGFAIFYAAALTQPRVARRQPGRAPS